MGDHRLLVAILLGGEVAAEIDGLRRALGSAELGRIPPHITLVAPVNVRADEVDEVGAAVAELAASIRPVAVTLGPPATFAPGRGVLFLRVEDGDEVLRNLHGAASVGPLAWPRSRPTRPFVPHVTLRSRMAPEQLEVATRLLAGYVRPANLTSVDVLEQVSETPGRPWRTCRSARFGGRSVLGRGSVELDVTVVDSLATDEAAWARSAWDEYGRSAYGSRWRPDAPFAVVARARGGSPQRPGPVLGVATGEVRGETCALDRLVVDPTRRGEGIGGHILRHVERLASERGCAVVRLLTRDGGPAEGFYAARGYRRSVVLPAWRDGRDFVVLVRFLSRG